MDSNNKPANTPANQDKQPQNPFASTSTKPNVSDNTTHGKADDAVANTNQSISTKPTDSKSSSTNVNTQPTDNKPNPASTSHKPIDDKPSSASTNSKSSSPSATAANKLNTATPSQPTSNNDAHKPANNGRNKGNGGTTPPPPSQPNKPKRSPLALLISLIALGVGGYALYQTMQKPQQQAADPAEIQALRTQLTELRQSLDSKIGNEDLTSLQQSVQSLDEQVQNQARAIESAPKVEPSLDEAQIQSLIDQQVQAQVSQAQQSLQQSLTAQLPKANEQESLSEEQVKTLIKDTLASTIQDTEQPAIDFSAEINTIKQDKADIQQYLSNIQQQGEALKNALNQAAQQASTTLNQSIEQAEQKISAADDRPIVYPLINSLTLAEVASNAHQYGVASQYLAQAKASFDSLNLNQPPYEKFAGEINALVNKTAQLADQQAGQKQIDGIINGVNQWPFINTNPENLLDAAPNNKPTESWKDDLKNIGSSILSNTVTITRNDAAGLTWVNDNPHLQQIVRENVRLDLAMIRNALLAGDQERAQEIVATLRQEVTRYFDENADSIKQAFATLEQITQQQGDAPDIASLIQSIQNAG